MCNAIEVCVNDSMQLRFLTGDFNYLKILHEKYAPLSYVWLIPIHYDPFLILSLKKIRLRLCLGFEKNLAYFTF